MAENNESTNESTNEGFVGIDGVFTEGWTGRDEFKENADTLSRFKNVTDLANSFIATKKKFGRNPDTLVEIPNDTSSDEVKAAWSKAHSVPDSLEGYEYALSTEMQTKLGPLNDERMSTLREFAKGKNWSPQDFKDVLDFYHNNMAGDIDAADISFTEQHNQAKDAGIAELKQLWKDQYGNKVNQANAILREYGGADAVADFNAENSPLMAKFLDNVAGAFSESALKGLGGTPGPSADTISSQIASIYEEISKIVKENPVNFKTNIKYKELIERKHELNKQRKASA